MTQQFAVLHPFSSFQRRSFSLSLLQLMASIFDEPNSSAASNPTSSTSSDDSTTSTIPSVFNFSSAVSPSQAKCLLDGLQDAFDANRLVCLELLLKLPAEMIGFTVSGENFSKIGGVSVGVIFLYDYRIWCLFVAKQLPI